MMRVIKMKIEKKINKVLIGLILIFAVPYGIAKPVDQDVSFEINTEIFVTQVDLKNKMISYRLNKKDKNPVKYSTMFVDQKTNEDICHLSENPNETVALSKLKVNRNYFVKIGYSNEEEYKESIKENSNIEHGIIYYCGTLPFPF